jgi:hypothetical protein
MSARKLDSLGLLRSISFEALQTRLLLAPSDVKVRRNGVEFRSPKPIAPWTEMTVSLQSNRDTARVQCTGVVVACNGTRYAGYTVSMVFIDLSKQAQARLSILAYS